MSKSWIGAIPAHLVSKAQIAINSTPSIGDGWKKLTGLKDCFTFRLNNNYRVLCWRKREYIVCDHDTYEKKIKLLRSRQGRYANRV